MSGSDADAKPSKRFFVLALIIWAMATAVLGVAAQEMVRHYSQGDEQI